MALALDRRTDAGPSHSHRRLATYLGGDTFWTKWTNLRTVLRDADYGRGHLYVLTLPDNFADLYALPPQVLARIRQVVMPDMPVRVDGPGQVARFA